MALRHLEDDGKWVSYFTEAKHYSNGNTLRCLFVSALLHGDVSDACALWEQFCADICNDLPHQVRNDFPAIPADFSYPHINYGLHLILQQLQEQGRSLHEYAMPVPQLSWSETDCSHLIATELDYDVNKQVSLRDQAVLNLSLEQRDTFDTIIEWTFNSSQTAHFFVHGAAGPGKTFLYETLCYYYCAEDAIILCVASTGIAAQLLPGGRTSHSCFRIPIICLDTSTSHVSARSELADLICRTTLIIWNEVPMQN